MSLAGLRTDIPRETTRSLIRAFAISMIIHCVMVGVYAAGRKYGLFPKGKLSSLAKLTPKELAALQKLAPPLKPKTPAEEEEPPLMFVDVNPKVATPEPPPKAQYYSTQSSEAANPNPDKDLAKPKIDGAQVHKPKTETINNPKSVPAPPSTKTPPKEPEPPKETPNTEPKPKGGLTAGELTQAKPELRPSDGLVPNTSGLSPSPPKKERVRTLAQAAANQAEGGMVGQKMLQDGGVKKNHIAPALDVKASPFGAYDQALIAAIENRWFSLLREQHFARDATGAVVVSFRLSADGKITEMKIEDTTVGDLMAYICERAISDPAPFATWPSDMKRIVGKSYRDVHFTFYYE